MKIAFQGCKGAYSEIACKKVYPNAVPVPCNTFDIVFNKVISKEVDIAVIPIENTIAGRVSDVHHLLPLYNLFIKSEYFLPIEHNLLGLKHSKIEDIKTVCSHAMAIMQCRNFIHTNNLIPIVGVDTAVAAKDLANSSDVNKSVISSSLAAEIYGLKVLKKNIQDNEFNVTRFVFLSRENNISYVKEKSYITGIIFDLKNVPSALYNVLEVFARHKINLTKLESYQPGKSFVSTRFYADIEGHVLNDDIKLVFEEVRAKVSSLRLVGSYESHPMRKEKFSH